MNTTDKFSIKVVGSENNKINPDFVVPNNTDEFQLSTKDGKKTFKINSFADYLVYVRECALRYQSMKTLATSSSKKLKELDVYNILSTYNLIQVVFINHTEQNEIEQLYVIKDYDNLTGMYIEAPIDTILNVISLALEINNFPALLKSITNRLTTNKASYSHFASVKLAPEYMILAPNGLLNAKTFKFYQDTAEIEKYNFLSRLPYRILEPSQIDRLMYEFVERIFDDWTEFNSDKLTYLKQMNVSAIEGNGRNVYNIIIGAGGNGKSVFLNILSNLATEYAVNFNIQDIVNDSKLNKIKPNTKVLAGDELATNFKLSDTTVSNFKSLATNGLILVDVKFKDATYVHCNGLKVQATNTLPKIFENNNAIKRRVKIFRWTDSRFDNQANNSLFDLDEVVNTTEFMEAVIAFSFTNIKPFKKFIEIKEMDDDIEDISNESDQIYQFLSYLNDQELLVGKFTTNILYDMYTGWNTAENGNIKPLKIRGFINRLKNHLLTFGLTLSDDKSRLSAFTDTDFNLSAINKFLLKPISPNKYNRARTIACHNQITESDLQKFYDDILLQNKYDNIVSYKDYIMLNHFINDNDPVAQAINEILNEAN